MAKASSNTPGRDRIEQYHRQFADSIIQQIEAGTAPWQKPWKPGEHSLPRNAVTGDEYRGGNSLYLSLRGAERGFADNRWATYRQIKEAGGHVRKGEHGEKILYVGSQRISPEKDEQGRPVVDEDGRPAYTRHSKRGARFWRTYTVFNVEQTEGLQLPPRDAPAPEWQRHLAAEAVIETSGVPIKHVPGDRAYYSSNHDQIVLPERRQFRSAEHYYATALHELSHASGHESRLNRESFHNAVKYPTGGFGSAPYAREELRAEIASMMTGERIGIGHLPHDGCGNQAAYVKSWIQALKNDPREIHRAAGEAERISRYLVEPARERIEQIGRNQPSSPAAAEMRVPALTPPVPARQQPAMTPGR